MKMVELPDLENNYSFEHQVIEDDKVTAEHIVRVYDQDYLGDVLNGMLEFLHACGYNYVQSLVAVKDDDKEITSEDRREDDFELEIDGMPIEDWIRDVAKGIKKVDDDQMGQVFTFPKGKNDDES